MIVDVYAYIYIYTYINILMVLCDPAVVTTPLWPSQVATISVALEEIFEVHDVSLGEKD